MSKRNDIGALKDQCDLFTLTPAKKGTGAKIPVRGDYATAVWCDFNSVSPTKEQIIENRAGRYETTYYGDVTFRYDENIMTMNMEFLYRGIYYKLVNKTNIDEAYFYIRCFCIGTKGT